MSNNKKPEEMNVDEYSDEVDDDIQMFITELPDDKPFKYEGEFINRNTGNYWFMVQTIDELVYFCMAYLRVVSNDGDVMGIYSILKNIIPRYLFACFKYEFFFSLFILSNISMFFLIYDPVSFIIFVPSKCLFFYN